VDDSQEKQGFELIPIPQDALGDAEQQGTHEVRRIWDKEEQLWYYSVIDFIELLTGSKNPKVYWSAMKRRNKQDQGFQDTLRQVKNIPLRAKDGRLRETECVPRAVMLRIVQNIPSPLAERVRLWLAQVGEEKLQEVEQQTQAEQLREYYIRQGRTPEWADTRIQNLLSRNALTDEWLARGAQQHLHFGLLTSTVHRGTFGISPGEHHQTVKHLPKGTKNPRDHYTEEELGVLTLAELAARRMHEQNDSQGVPQLLQDSQAAGAFGGRVRQQFEELTGQPVVSSQNFLDQPKGKRKKQQLPAPEQGTLFETPTQEPSEDDV
jgi:DNA-damage-inducible protein D